MGLRLCALESLRVIPKELLLSLWWLLGLGVGAKLARKGLPAGSWHWQALPKTIFSKRIVVVVVVVVGLGGFWGEACSKRPGRGELALASFAEAIFPKELLLSLWFVNFEIISCYITSCRLIPYHLMSSSH